MAKSVTRVILSSISQKTHVQTSGAHQEHLPGIFREQTGGMRPKIPHPLVTLVTALTETAKGSGLLIKQAQQQPGSHGMVFGNGRGQK